MFLLGQKKFIGYQTTDWIWLVTRLRCAEVFFSLTQSCKKSTYSTKRALKRWECQSLQRAIFLHQRLAEVVGRKTIPQRSTHQRGATWPLIVVGRLAIVEDRRDHPEATWSPAQPLSGKHGHIVSIVPSMLNRLMNTGRSNNVIISARQTFGKLGATNQWKMFRRDVVRTWWDL
jgi:hypothetical protein